MSTVQECGVGPKIGFGEQRKLDLPLEIYNRHQMITVDSQ